MKKFSTAPWLAGLAVFGLACGGDSNGPGMASTNTTPVSLDEANNIGGEVHDQITGITVNAAWINFLSPHSFPVPFEADRLLRHRFQFDSGSTCPTLSQFPIVDSDSDGVPDNLTLTFDPTACTFQNHWGHASKTLSGTVTITDPSTTARGARLDFAQFQELLLVDDTTNLLRGVDGVWQLTKDSTGFNGIDSTTVVHVDRPHHFSYRAFHHGSWSDSDSVTIVVDTLANALVVSFTADSGFVFQHRHRLPSGLLVVNGTIDRVNKHGTRTLVITTVTPLHFDSTCEDDHRIVSGEVKIDFTNPSETGSIDIVYNGCGVDPTITRTVTPTT
jgi:hypothetical protein